MAVLFRLPIYVEPPTAPEPVVVAPTPPPEEDVTYPEGVERPRTRGECADIARPCPFVSCSQHLYWDYLKHHPGAEVETLKHSCTLDVADDGGLTLEEVGEMMGLTRERIRQIEDLALRKLKKRPAMQQFRSD